MKKQMIIISLVGLFLISGPALSVAEEPAERGNAASAGALPDELKGMDVKDYFIELDAKHVGRVMKLEGSVVVLHKETNQAFFAAKGDYVYGKDTFYTLKDARCRVGFITGDIITMAANTTISADEIVNDREKKEKKSAFSMVKGKAMFYVMRLLGYKKVDASVKTRTAVMGVRGTKFGVEVVPGSMKVGQAKKILVADASGSGFHMLAEAGQQGGNAGYSKLIVFAGRVFGIRSDGKLVEVEAGDSAIFSETEYKVYGTTKEDVKAFLEAVGAAALFDGKTEDDQDEGFDGGFEGDLDEIIQQLQEDGFIIDAEPEEESIPPYYYMRSRMP